MALNGALAATYAGASVPLAFVLGFATIGCVAFSFVEFARVYASPASVGEFNARGLSPYAGRLSAWALLLVYLLFTAGAAAEFGAFAGAALTYAGITAAWVPLALGCLVVSALVGTRAGRFSSRAMLAIEGISVAAVVALSVAILARGGATGWSLAPFTVRANGVGGLGLATVFAFLSFAGFEGAAVLGAESLDPKRTIPRALAAGVVLAGVLYVFVVYAQTLGFGADPRGSAAFAAAASPLTVLAERYAGVAVAAAVGAGAAISAFAATLASATAAARLVMSLAQDGFLPANVARVDVASGTPAVAFLAVLGLSAGLDLAFAAGRGSGTDAFAAYGTVGVLALVAVYGAVQVAALRLFGRRWHPLERLIPILALVALAATFLANVIPIPAWPAALYPYVVVVWMIGGAALLRRARA
jgi:amino acid transporter